MLLSSNKFSVFEILQKSDVFFGIFQKYLKTFFSNSLLIKEIFFLKKVKYLNYYINFDV